MVVTEICMLIKMCRTMHLKKKKSILLNDNFLKHKQKQTRTAACLEELRKIREASALLDLQTFVSCVYYMLKKIHLKASSQKSPKIPQNINLLRKSRTADLEVSVRYVDTRVRISRKYKHSWPGLLEGGWQICGEPPFEGCHFSP